MTLGELWPDMRRLSRVLAVLGWICAVLGMGAALIVAIFVGLSVSPRQQMLQFVGASLSGLSVVLLATAALTQPLTQQRSALWQLALSNELPVMVRSFYFSALMMLVGATAFTVIGLVLPGGPTAQTFAFSQLFLTGTAACALSYLMFSRACSIDMGR